MISEQEYPGLFKLVNYYIYLSKSDKFHQYFYHALAMNTPIIAKSNQSNKQSLDKHFVYFYEDNIQTTLNQSIQKGLRGYVISKYSQLNLDWTDSWEESNLKYFQEKIFNLEVVAIVGWGRSGSTFLHSLFDHHPEVLTMGARSFIGIQNYARAWDFILRNPQTNIEGTINLFCEFMSEKNLPNMHIFHTENQGFKAQFKYYCLKIINTFEKSKEGSFLGHFNRKLFFKLIQLAYCLALGEDIRSKRIIFYQLHWAEPRDNVSSIVKDFPDLKLLGIIRTPIRGINSLIASGLSPSEQFSRECLLANSVYVGNFASQYKQILIGWQVLESSIQHPLYPVTLETLHEYPEKTLKGICNWINIQWNESLFKSTNDGVSYTIHSGIHGKVDKKHSVFSPERTNYDHWTDNFNELDEYVLTGLSRKTVEKYGIQKVSKFQYYASHFLLFIPTKIEYLAIIKAIKEQSIEKIKLTALSMLERYYFSYMNLCNFSFLSSELNRPKHKDLGKVYILKE